MQTSAVTHILAKLKCDRSGTKNRKKKTIYILYEIFYKIAITFVSGCCLSVCLFWFWLVLTIFRLQYIYLVIWPSIERKICAMFCVCMSFLLMHFVMTSMHTQPTTYTHHNKRDDVEMQCNFCWSMPHRTRE